MIEDLLKEDIEATMKRYDVSPEAEQKRREVKNEDKEPTILDICCGMDLYVDSDQLPDIENWKVGGEYMMIVKVKQTSMSIHHNANEKKSTRATLQIQEIMVPKEPMTEKKEEKMEEEETEDASVEAYVTGE